MKKIILLTLMLLGAVSAFAMEDSYKSDKKLSAFTTIIINDFDTKSMTINLLDEDEMSKFKPLLPQMVKNITDTIVSKVKEHTKFKSILINNQEPQKNAVRLEGKIDEFNGGHGAAKWALGFMAPKSVKTYLSYSGKLVDVETGNVLGTFSDTNTGSLWFKDSLSYSQDMMENIGKDVFDFIENNYN
ncbi:DUF4410 domain-containing protein [Trichlorobacter lovleyi]|uniref:DUF4410 domain-containing protein n=1 Tax=Trichlorobacter lovleyi TaxID=313985 RepID=UPI00223EF4BF|nr:DUF4410 domain-containing protein [Trichlorobacter lovleyi]QOX78369.1 DUF4410 domain-containing protein [Trichlorobacter lovleyi]